MLVVAVLAVSCASKKRDFAIACARLSPEVAVINRYLDVTRPELGGGCAAMEQPQGADAGASPACSLAAQERTACHRVRGAAYRLQALPRVTAAPDPTANVRASAGVLFAALGECEPGATEACAQACREQREALHALTRAIDRLATVASEQGVKVSTAR